METVGKFEFSRKDLIGHGAFAVVFKGRHKEKPDWEVAVKCINKKNLAKSQTLLGKEIKILKELKHENIVALYDFQYCNGGDLADYLHSDFGFARYLQTNMMAATLCGSPMYMAPEVIMSQSYDAKADLWSIGTIVFQCLTGKAPFQASSPQDLRLFYEKNKNLTPNIPRETSTHLRHLLSGLLKRNHKDRMDFDEFFRHPFLEVCSSMKKSAPVPMPSYPSSGSASSCSSSSTSHLASPPQSVVEMQQLRAKTLASPTQDSPGFLHGLKDSAGSSKDSSCDMDDFVMVPVQFSSDIASEATGEKPVLDSLMCSGSSLLISAGLGSQGKTPSQSPSFSNSPSPSGRPTEFSASNYGQSVPIPVPTQIHNYQRIEQNLHCPSQHISPRSGPPVRKSSSASPLGFGRSGTSPPFPGDHGTAFSSRRLSAGGSKPYQPSPQGLTVPEHLPRHDMSSRLHSAPNLSEGGANFCRQKIKKQHSDPVVHRQCSQPQQVPSLQPGRQLRSSPKLSELVLHRSPLPTILGSPTKAMPPFEFPKPPSSQNLVTLLAQQGLVLTPTRNRTIPDLKELGQPFCQQNGPSMRPVEENKGAFGRSLSAGRLSEMLLKAAFGGQVLDSGSRESLNTERPMDTAPPSGDGADLHSGAMVVGSGCPAPVVFTVGSPPSGSTPPQTNRTRMFSVGSSSSLSSGGSFSGRQFLTGTCADGCEGPSSLRYGFSDPVAASLEGGVTFEAPELPEETLMEQEHTETLRSLRFTLAFVHCVMEIAATKGMVTEGGSSVTSSFQLQESMVADQISLLSREWSYAEQLVLYMKTTELLSASLHTAMESIKQGKLCPSTTVKQVVKKLNELYKSSVSSCRSLNARLQRFFYDKQKLMDRINSITADKLIYNHTVHMIQSAALDEMFHHGEASVQRYHKALLLMEGLSLIINEQADVENISKLVANGTCCPLKCVLLAACFFTRCKLTVQPPRATASGGQRSPGQLTGKAAGALPDYRGRWCVVS
ncbi:UNVERIFIED_CONTAM: hypothetical protein FKN15_056000 [Acipenser sinensis]